MKEGTYFAGINEDYEVTDVCFYNLETDRGTFAMELRVSHNGYYGGSLCILEAPKDNGYKDLTEEDKVLIDGMWSKQISDEEFNDLLKRTDWKIKDKESENNGR